MDVTANRYTSEPRAERRCDRAAPLTYHAIKGGLLETNAMKYLKFNIYYQNYENYSVQSNSCRSTLVGMGGSSSVV